MKLLDFKAGKLYMKHYDILINYERFMPEKAASIASIKNELKAEKSGRVGGSLNVTETRGDLNKDASFLAPEDKTNLLDIRLSNRLTTLDTRQ